MKKLLALVLALALVATMFAACGKDKKTDDKPADKATEVPAATDAPADPTEVPTEAPTAEPTAEPTPKDPHAQELVDYDDYEGGVQNYSFDTIKFNTKTITDGGVLAWKSENDSTIDGTDGSIKTVTLRGWLGLYDQAFVDAGYIIDDGYARFGSGTFENTSSDVIAAGGEFAQRFYVEIPVATLAGEGHTICVVLKAEDGELIKINGGQDPYELYYDGPATVEAPAVDGTIDAAEYDFKYTMNKDNVVVFTDTGSFEGNLDYYFRTTSDALYIGMVANGVADGDYIQVNFNPNGKLDTVSGQFISFITGETPKVLQHNHKNNLLDNAADGAEITSLIEVAYVKGEDGSYNMEAKLPVGFFQTTDVEGAAEFTFAKGNTLYFGIFDVIGGKGYTLQKDVDFSANDWHCNSLDLYQMAIVF